MSQPVSIFDDKDPEMQKAHEAAQNAFRYFWRELSWERRRIVPGLDMAIVKLPFTDGPRTDGNPEFEQMWVGGVDFDGDSVSGTLLNAPNGLKSVSKGAKVSAPFGHVADWMMTASGRAYGGFTVNLIRSRMGRAERQMHDQAWGLDFGDPAEVRVEIVREPKPEPKPGLMARLFGGGSRPQPVPEGFKDHPMCVNMVLKIEAQLHSDRSIATMTDDKGWTLLQQDALAGNLGVVKLLVTHGADCAARTPNGYTAAELAQKIGWPKIAAFIREQSKA